MAVRKFKVPQKDSEITIAGATEEPLKFTVTDHIVTIRDEKEAAIFADRISDAEPVESGGGK